MSFSLIASVCIAFIVGILTRTVYSERKNKRNELYDKFSRETCRLLYYCDQWMKTSYRKIQVNNTERGFCYDTLHSKKAESWITNLKLYGDYIKWHTIEINRIFAELETQKTAFFPFIKKFDDNLSEYYNLTEIAKRALLLQDNFKMLVDSINADNIKKDDFDDYILKIDTYAEDICHYFSLLKDMTFMNRSSEYINEVRYQKSVGCRAKMLWLDAGKPSDRDLEFWHAAEELEKESIWENTINIRGGFFEVLLMQKANGKFI